MRILLIEDEEEVADYLGMFLREAGYFVFHAPDARTARQKAEEPFDLILLDLVLPDATGPELLPLIRAAAPKTPVVIVSGLAFDDERLLYCLKNGAAGYVPKSSRAEDLLVAVRRALRE